MKNVKRIEIIIDSLETNHLIKSLEKSGYCNYTIIDDVKGRGQRGIRRNDSLADDSKNNYVLIACEPESAEDIINIVRPLLKRVGGLCLVSDAAYIIH
ncbi:MAG: hypothetical protein K9I71_00930 [Ignavibacteriales bacterium]|nr:hypothetical protein [Ignavibacteriales bacterium]MCF8314650.1 hypothetical protein [Ignavibacteriales bacterium]MCF8436313.1 hypothetical protein [Ignavibacteriales bacterium]